MKTNLIGHFDTATSNKLYIAALRDNKDGTWSTVGKWGRVGGTMREKVRFTGTQRQANLEQEKVFERKVSKGYVDIESSNYGGHLTPSTLSSNAYLGLLEPEIRSVLGANSAGEIEEAERALRKAEGMARIANAKSHTETADGQAAAPVIDEAVEYTEKVKKICEVKEPEDLVVICKDNHGIENQFTIGLEYLAEEIDREFVHAWNKFGELTILDKDRFERVAQ